MVSNLVGNAVQHGDRSRPITVALEEREAAALLNITREIVKAHGGSIRATSTEADGTTFAITLPRLTEGGVIPIRRVAREESG